MVAGWDQEKSTMKRKGKLKRATIWDCKLSHTWASTCTISQISLLGIVVRFKKLDVEGCMLSIINCHMSNVLASFSFVKHREQQHSGIFLITYQLWSMGTPKMEPYLYRILFGYLYSWGTSTCVPQAYLNLSKKKKKIIFF